MFNCVVAVLPLLLAAPAMQATVTGTVRDAETGQAIAGAIVTLTDLDRAAATDSTGRYVLAQVPAGPQHLAVRFIGYSGRSLHALVPREGVLEIDVSLRPLPVLLEPVEVRAPVSIRGIEGGSTTPFPDREMSSAAIANHPLLAEPDVFQALGGGEVQVRPESPDGVHIRGGSTDQTAYVLDGIPVFSPYHAAGVASAWNPDAVSRLTLASTSPPGTNAHALSGVIEASTRKPGDRMTARGSLSTTQARLTLDGPLGSSGAGHVLSMRRGMHDAIAPRGEPSYLQGGTGDWLAKVEAPAWGGRARLLGYGNSNEIGAADNVNPPIRRNRFEWYSLSLGADWKREFGAANLRLLGWGASGDAGASWNSAAGPLDLAANRQDEGFAVAIERRSKRATTALEVRLERSRTTYRVTSDSAGGPATRLEAETPVATALGRCACSIGQRLESDLGAALALSGDDVYPEARAQLRWQATEQWVLSGSYARTHQFAQSLRNTESVVGHLFPVDVFMGAGAPEIPVARSDQGVVAADYRPLPGLRLGLQFYERSSDGLVLVAPRDGGPFTTGRFVVGSASARGLSIEAAAGAARYGFIASYGWQDLRYAYGDTSYVPEHGAEHVLEGGLIVFPSASTAIRVGVNAAWGRRTTTIPDGLEWESCNLLDQGCEFVGSPDYGDEPLGATELPAYLRVDLGLRQHWHIEIAGRDASLAIFGTYTNLLGRTNLLTYARDPVTGELKGIELRPSGPLVVGLDWRF